MWPYKVVEKDKHADQIIGRVKRFKSLLSLVPSLELMMKRLNKIDKKMNEFSELETTAEIASKIEEITLKDLEENTEFLAKYPNPIYATMRLSYLATSENEEKWETLIDRYYDKTLMSHLMETQEMAIKMMREEKPKMMKSFGLTEELKAEDPQKYEQ